MTSAGELVAEAGPALEDHIGVIAPNVKIEPLVDRWYAWTHLLSPVQGALNLAFRFLPVARSFVAAPAVHAAATQDPTMYGGPFMELPGGAVDEVRRYVGEMETGRAEALAFARQFREYELHLQSTATGYSLNEMREQMPATLCGRVELAYDRHHHPRMRLLDEMFVLDDLGLSRAQGVLLNTQRDVDRPFHLSTPRLSLPGSLYLERPLGSAAVQALCEARDRPTRLDDLAEQLGTSRARLAPFFVAPQAPRRRPLPPPADGVRVRYFGHACILIETSTSSVLVDPTFAIDELDNAEHLTLGDLPDRIDVVFISHGHQDHFLPEALMQLRHRVGTVLIPPCNQGELADPPLKRILTGLGYKSIVVLDPLESYALPDGVLTALPFSGEHCDLDVHSKQCAVLEVRGKKICLFVDSDAIDIETYKRLAPRLDNPDIMFLGMECNGAPLSWLYGPLIPAPIAKRIDGSRRLSGADCAKAWRLAEAIRPKRAFVYAMGQEAWLRFLMGLNYTPDSIQLAESSAFVENCRLNGIEAARLINHAEIHL
jgi:L-ascorbate metabolism protein UlaG (beta-lactamase superfamily)